MSEGTRIVRLGCLVDREEATNDGTRVSVCRVSPGWLNLRSLFEAHHRELARALCEEPRPGVMIFALSARAIEGRLWLAATEELRCGSIGRHGCADLYLPGEDALSLRHCLALVRRRDDGARIHVLDLSSSAGLQGEGFEPVRAVDADGHFFLRLPGGLLAFFPTGARLPWDPRALSAFATLAPRREQAALAPRPRPLFRADPRPSGGGSQITYVPGPVDAGRDPPELLGRGLAGHLRVESDGLRDRVPLGPDALARGVLLGRDARCVGAQVLRSERISRVHALLLRRDEGLFLADVGSTNGTWRGERELRCAPVEVGVDYGLGADARVRWEPAS